MNASVAVALAYFSFVGLQKWLNWIFGALLAVGLVIEVRAETSHSLGGGLALATVSAVLMMVAPVFAGGLVMRVGSTRTALHLRPEGRRHMLVGATLAVTFAAILLSSPILVAQLGNVDMPGKTSRFTHPALGMFEIMWGGIALVWIIVFALSRHQILAAFSFVLVTALANGVFWSGSWLPITADQFGTLVMVTGAGSWIAFARWYLRTPSVTPPGWNPGGAALTAPVLVRFGNWRGIGQALGGTGEQRSTAVCQYLTGFDGLRHQILLSTLVTLLFLAEALFSDLPMRPQQASMFFFIGVFGTPILVTRSRLLWLRSGLDRNGLFQVVERQAWRHVLSLCSLPAAFFVASSFILAPGQTLRVVLFLLSQLTFAICLVYAGLAATRASKTVLIGVVFPSVLLWIFMDPEARFSDRTSAIALAVAVATAFGLRAYARSQWLKLDWRLSGPPMISQGWGRT